MVPSFVMYIISAVVLATATSYARASATYVHNKLYKKAVLYGLLSVVLTAMSIAFLITGMTIDVAKPIQ